MKYDIFHNLNLNTKDDKIALTESYNTKKQWELVDQKAVPDADGFLTDYCWYTDGDLHIFMFGDNELYEPDVDYADHVCESEKEAQDWFSSYEGFVDAEDEMSLDEELLTEDLSGFPQWLKPLLSNKSVSRVLSNRDIDLQNAQYIKAAPPRSSRDPILKDATKLCVYRLDLDRSGTNNVYIAGVNDIEAPDDAGNWTYISKLPYTQLFSRLIEFGYIDLTDATNSNKDIRAERIQLHQIDAPKRNPRYGQREITHYDGSKEWYTDLNYDKSGYKLDPHKYQRMLDSVDLTTYSARLRSFYNKITATQRALNDVMQKITLDNYDYNASADAYDRVDDAVRYLRNAVRYYRALEDDCEYIINSDDVIDEEDRNHDIQRAFRRRAADIRSELAECSEYIGKVAAMYPDVAEEAAAIEDAAELSAE